MNRRTGRQKSLLVFAVSVVVGSLCLAAPGVAQKKKKKNRQSFDEVTQVTVVEVPVQVTVKGEPLRQLTRDDFEILDGRKEREIIGFEMVDLSSETEPLAIQEVPVAARRHFLVFFDLSFSKPDSIERARKAASNLVLESLHPSDLVAVATYSQAKGPQMVLGFTTDRNQVRQAIETLGLVTPADSVRDPLGLVIGDIDGDLRPSESGGGGGAAGIQDMLAEVTRDLGSLTGRVARDQEKNQVLALTSSLELVANMMAGLEGRKHLLFLSEGFDSSVLVGNQGISNEDQARTQELAQNVQDGQSWLVDNEERYGSSQAQSVMNSVLDAFRQADCTIQAIDIGGLVAGQHNSRTDGLLMMAKDTGGELFTNYNDLGEAMSEMLTRNSVTYLLAFQPTDLVYDGEFHRLKVNLKNGPRGADLTYRGGYYAPKPYQAQSPLERRLKTAQTVIAGQAGGQLGADVLAAAFTVPGEKAYVPVIVELNGPSFLHGLEGSSAILEVYGYAVDEQGTVRDFFAHKLGLDADQAGPVFRQNGLKYWGHFDLDPGHYSVRVLLRNEATGLEGLTTTDLVVPDNGEAGELALLPPLFPEPPGVWAVAREEESEQREVAFPFMINDQPFLPAAVPQVSAGKSMPVSLVGYNLGAGALSVSAQVLDDAGAVVEKGGELTLEEGTAGKTGLSRLPATFKAGNLAPGEYLLVVTVTNAATNQSVTSTTSIRVA